MLYLVNHPVDILSTDLFVFSTTMELFEFDYYYLKVYWTIYQLRSMDPQFCPDLTEKTLGFINLIHTSISNHHHRHWEIFSFDAISNGTVHTFDHAQSLKHFCEINSLVKTLICQKKMLIFYFFQKNSDRVFDDFSTLKISGNSTTLVISLVKPLIWRKNCWFLSSRVFDDFSKICFLKIFVKPIFSLFIYSKLIWRNIFQLTVNFWDSRTVYVCT